MIVDCNAYVGKWPYWPNPYMSEDGLLRLMDRHDVARAVVTSTRSIMIDPREGNVECREIAARHPDRINWLACVNPCDDEAALVECERAVEEGAVALRLTPQHQSWSLSTDPFVDELVAAVERWRKPVVLPLRLIMDWRLPMLGIAELAAFVAKHPGATFVLSGINYHDLRVAVAIMKRNPATFIETSCLMGRGSVERLVEAVGAGRVLLGLGLPLQSGLCGLEKIRHADIDERAIEGILGVNALRLYGMGAA